MNKELMPRKYFLDKGETATELQLSPGFNEDAKTWEQMWERSKYLYESAVKQMFEIGTIEQVIFFGRKK